MLMRAAYGLASRMAVPFALAYFSWRGRAEPEYSRHWRERLGREDKLPAKPIWVHAASVGEVILATPLVKALLDAHPDKTVLVTTFTPTGRAEAQRRLGNQVALAYLPLDSPGATRCFMEQVRPLAGIFVETELWPNLIAAGAASGVPLLLVNASISERSAKAYGRWPLKSLAHFMLSRFTHILAADPVHARRFTELGASADRVQVSGNLKYDRAENPGAADKATEMREAWQASQRPVWLAASTHDPEEAELLQAFARLRQTQDDLLWVVAPRHPQRFDTVAELLAGSGWNWSRRSAGEPVTAETDIVLADTLGELDLFYALSDVAFVGGSLAPGVGGHNIIEAAAAARVFTTGPCIDDWREPMEAMTAAGGAVAAEDIDGVIEATAHWLAHPEQRESAGRAIAAIAKEHRGALQRTLTELEAVLASR